jgi:hypothetical protein
MSTPDPTAMAATPYEPPGLRDIVAGTRYKAGWMIFLHLFREDDDEAPRGWRLHIVSDTADSYAPDRRIRVNHAFPVPPTSWNERTWKAWIRDRFADVEAHELGEFLTFDGVREYGPHHGNGEDPYRVWHVGDYADTRVKAGHGKPVWHIATGPSGALRACGCDRGDNHTEDETPAGGRA